MKQHNDFLCFRCDAIQQPNSVKYLLVYLYTAWNTIGNNNFSDKVQAKVLIVVIVQAFNRLSCYCQVFKLNFEKVINYKLSSHSLCFYVFLIVSCMFSYFKLTRSLMNIFNWKSVFILYSSCVIWFFDYIER